MGSWFYIYTHVPILTVGRAGHHCLNLTEIIPSQLCSQADHTLRSLQVQAPFLEASGSVGGLPVAPSCWASSAID